jgi:hypothetical protein
VNDDQDQRPADLYAFGKTVWALLAGRDPFAREDYRDSKWRLATITGEPRLDRLDGLFDMVLAADLRVRVGTSWDEVIAELRAVENAMGGTSEPEIPPATGTVDIARAYAQRNDVLERRAAKDRFLYSANWMQLSAMPALQDGLSIIRDALTSIQEASNGEILFWISDESLGLELGNYFAEFLSQSGSPAIRELVRSGHYWGANSSGGSPRLVLQNWFRATESDATIASMPILYWPSDYGLPERVLYQHAAKLGPLTPGREASVESARAFGRARAELFLRLATRYVEMVADDKDMVFGDPNEWNLGP